MLDTPIKTLEAYVNQPSGTLDREDVQRFAEMVAEDFRSLGFNAELIPGEKYGPKLRATIGSGERQLMLMGHMDTVFPHDICVPFKDIGNGKAMGSGIIDMKGGDVVMLYALKQVLPKLDLSKYRIRLTDQGVLTGLDTDNPEGKGVKIINDPDYRFVDAQQLKTGREAVRSFLQKYNRSICSLADELQADQILIQDDAVYYTLVHDDYSVIFRVCVEPEPRIEYYSDYR